MLRPVPGELTVNDGPTHGTPEHTPVPGDAVKSAVNARVIKHAQRRRDALVPLDGATTAATIKNKYRK